MTLIKHTRLAAAVAAAIVSATGASPRPAPEPLAAVHRDCPPSARGALPLRPRSIQRAADRALASAARDYPGLDTRGAQVMASARSAFGGLRGREVRYLCGRKIAARTVVVQMLFPRMLPSASLSEGVVFVGRFRGGYRVWYIAH